MRFSLQKLILAIGAIVLVQIAIYLWNSNKPRRNQKTVFVMKQMQRKQILEDGSCDFNKCNPVKEGMLNVHLIPHSHDDVGWLKTVEQYYTGEAGGSGRSQHPGTECVRCVLNTTIPLLVANPNRRFIFIEMAFLERYWREISPDIQNQIKKLIKDRRLELAIGGWCMSDAATTFYNDIIDQHTLGFDFIEKHFGKCGQSRYGWHVDQFGHSREHSSIFAQMGFDGLFVGRIDFQDYNDRHQNKKMEFLWKSSANLGDKASLFTHVSYDGYYAPRELQFEGRRPDNVKSSTARYVQDMIRIAKERARVFKTQHLMFPMGADFAYRQANEWFSNMDALIENTNLHQADGSNVNLLYSTPSCYLHYVNKEKITLPTKSDDFFPYAIPPKAYWTGYFTSRAGMKLHVKKAGSILQACKELNVMTRLTGTFDRIEVLKRAQGILQHHDAITGTEKEHVANDYNKLLSEGIEKCESVIKEAFPKLFLKSEASKEDIPKFEFCEKLNITECDVSESNAQFFVHTYNPLSRAVDHWMRLPVSDKKYKVIDGNSNEVTSDMIPISEKTKSIPGRKSTAANEIVFLLTLPPFGFKTVYVSAQLGSGNLLPVSPAPKSDFTVGNKMIELAFDGNTGLVKSATNLNSGKAVKLEQDFYYYIGDTSMRASGAYVFIPKFKNPTKIRGQNPVAVKIVQGVNVKEIHQEFSSWVSQVIRLYDNSPYVELEWQVGPIPGNDYVGREVISRFNTNIDSKGEFYTDSNGREMLKRRRDKRETWNLQVIEAVSGNYYPITSKMFIQDESKDVRVSVMTDRCQAGGSIQDGSMELMVHRRLFRDDGLGVSENLNELGEDQKGIIYKGKHYLFIDGIEKSNEVTRDMALKIHLQPTLSFTATTTNFDAFKTVYNYEWSGLRNRLPPNVNILTLDQILPGETEVYLLRLEHIYEAKEHSELSKEVTVSLEELFTPFNIVFITELSLGGNFHISDVTRLQWTTDDGSVSPSKIGSTQDSSTLQAPFHILLKPMEIRTFRIQISARDS
ncbi:hypothetical protein LOTGIDRAFT_232262 [Lottia gigantea]|uniref:Alpha-mannosidase n=1 Tax=Lottia gigantea TaxID=225164 RepID=V4AHZ5_LOTGI|nr:hypothetical protein LOTGIDRAFT_232262 [Lottia gigantea]ESO94820.1 hypothetical protein LOTGIDRAFT_232262 [Lottia gigantea]